MEVLILSVQTGEGHHATGKALQDQFESMGVNCHMIDAFEYIDPKLSKVVSTTYGISAAYIPKFIADVAYNALVSVDKPSRKRSPVNIANTMLSEELYKKVLKFNPDVVICTHVMSAMMAQKIRQRHKVRTKIVGIVTDYTVHPMWQNASDLDFYVVPSDLLCIQMQKKGLSTDTILPFGIPLRTEFSTIVPHNIARRKLGINEDKRTVLVMSGSMGHGRMDKVIEQLDILPFDLQILVVCGNNEKMKSRIEKLVHAKSKKMNQEYLIYGYVKNVDEMMDAADCIVSKPGGITCSEALGKELPMVMINPIPGWEERNAEWMLNNGLGLYATKAFSLEEAMYSLLKDERRIDNLRKTIEIYGKKHATRHLCEFLVDMVKNSPKS